MYINGRFTTQTLSGVQRFATEVTAALQQAHPDRVVLLGPPGAPGARAVGRWQGQVWEQMELPRYVGQGVLINLGNTAPLRLHRQVVVIHDAGVFATPEAYSWRLRSWYRLAHRRLVRTRACIATVSQFARDNLARHLAVPPEAIALVSEGADHMHAILAERSILQTLPGARFVLAVGNLAAHKNLAALSALAADLARRGVALVITGGLAGAAFRRPREAALPQPAAYLGRVSDGQLKALYQAALCLVFPSRYEGFGLPALEAMASGCPVAAAHIPALRETCGDAAIYFDPASPPDIARQVGRLIDDEALREALRAAGRSRAAGFTWAHAAAQLAALADAVP